MICVFEYLILFAATGYYYQEYGVSLYDFDGHSLAPFMDRVYEACDV